MTIPIYDSITPPTQYIGYQTPWTTLQQFDPIWSGAYPTGQHVRDVNYPAPSSVQFARAPSANHHHHFLPLAEWESSKRHDEGRGTTSFVGKAGMPEPARPSTARAKFTLEDDALIVSLKAKGTLSWKQIAEFFPGRSPGTIQVRYCKKLTPQQKQWSEEADQRLLEALECYEKEKWRIVSKTVGAGFTADNCLNRAGELRAKTTMTYVP